MKLVWKILTYLTPLVLVASAMAGEHLTVEGQLTPEAKYHCEAVQVVSRTMTESACLDLSEISARAACSPRRKEVVAFAKSLASDSNSAPLFTEESAAQVLMGLVEAIDASQGPLMEIVNRRERCLSEALALLGFRGMIFRSVALAR